MSQGSRYFAESFTITGLLLDLLNILKPSCGEIVCPDRSYLNYMSILNPNRFHFIFPRKTKGTILR